MKRENSWPISGPTHISTYPLSKGGSLSMTQPKEASKEGGPGSGPQGGGGGKPNVIAHYTYSGPRYTAGLKLPKEEPKTATAHATTQSPANDVKSKNDAELKRRQASMYQSAGMLSHKSEADSGSSNSQVLRSNKNQEKSETKSKGEFTIRTRFSEANTIPTSGSRYRVVLIKEGMGNLRDCFYYSKECLQNSVQIFEGKKAFIDHPSSMEEEIRPERSTKDICGYYENVEYALDADNRGMLLADLCLGTDPSFDWTRSMLNNSIEYSKKFPDSDFVGLSINASGNANEVPIEQFLRETDVPKSVLPKLHEAQTQGIMMIRVVSQLKDAVSCDLVTEAGAGGRILKMIEQEKKPMGFPDKKDDKAVDKETEKKESGLEKEAKAHEGEDPAAADHADADQDKELFASMIKQYLGDDHADNGEAMEMGKHAYECSKEAGMEHEAALEAAGKHLQMASAIGKKMSSKQAAPTEAVEKETTEAKESDDADKSAEPAPATDPKKKVEIERHYEAARKEILTLKGENARLTELNKKYELRDYLEKKLKECGEATSLTKKFREALSSFKSKEQIDSEFKTFMKGAQAVAAGYDGVGYSFMEKSSMTTQSKKAEGSFSDCLV
jgi:hypothetical protein